ncbi:hypothetical protein KL909_000643 [Ogataea angusta]|nr:hypothetical protein KL909_000643 [Ogataea angusta]
MEVPCTENARLQMNLKLSEDVAVTRAGEQAGWKQNGLKGFLFASGRRHGPPPLRGLSPLVKTAHLSSGR